MFWRDEPLIRLLVTTPSTVNAFSAPLAPLTWKPPSISPEFTDGAVRASDWKLRPFGIRSISSAVTLCDTRVLRDVDGRPRVGLHLDDLGHVADLQLRVDLERLAQADRDVVHRDLGEAGELDDHRIAARVEIGHVVEAVARW